MKKLFGLGLLSTVLLMNLVGCSDGQVLEDCGTNSPVKPVAENVVIMAGNHSNSVKPDYSTISSDIYEVALNEGSIAAVIDDGNPFVACDISIEVPKKGLSRAKKESIAKEQASQVIEYLGSEECIAKTEELSIIQSLELVSRLSKTDKYDGNTDLYVFDTGLSTLDLDLTGLDLNKANPEEIVRVLKEENMIPDLSGIENVYWYGLCDVDGNQDKLSMVQANTVKEIWEAVLLECGVNYIDFKTDVPKGTYEIKLPDITPIQSLTSALEWNTSSCEEDVFPEIVVFDEETIGFKSGKAELIDEDMAISALEKTSNYLKNNKDFKVLMVGSTAHWGTEEYCIKLAEQRCDVIENLLVSKMGVNQNQIIKKGMGYDTPFYKNDCKADGTLDEKIAPSNRITVLMDANSEIAKSIINNTWKEN